LSWLINIAIVVCIVLLVALLFRDKPEDDLSSMPEMQAEPVTPDYTDYPVTEIITTPAETTPPPETTPAETTSPTETTPSSETTPADAVTETPTETLPLASGDYDKAYFDNFLFIGDSISTGLSGFDFLSAANVFAKIGYTPTNVRTDENNGVTVYQKLAVQKPETVVIMLGTNGLSYISTDAMIKDYSLFIDEIRDILPDSRIVILSIPPVTKVHEETKPENIALIKGYNEALLTMSEEKETDFIDVYTLLADGEGYTRTEYAEADGLHVKGPAYKAILHLIETTLKGDTAE
jgi:hypothetical protein